MATVVETFFIEETVNLIHDGDALAKWNEKVTELGLEGQREVVAIDKSPIPFLWMNQAVIATFETLCPTKVSINEYSKQPIPVELLETVSLCVKENYFDGIKVWYNDKQKDPVLVGYKMKDGKSFGNNWESDYYSERYLIGRWADVKASLDSLIQRAKAVFISAQKTELSMMIKQQQRMLEDVELNAEVKFGGGMPSTPGLPF